MADKTPLKATYSGSDTNGLAEFINTDTIGIADGGTGATTAGAARTALGVSPTAGSSSLTTLGTISTGVWEGTDVAIAHGGTGASTAGAALTALGASPLAGSSSITTTGTVTSGTWSGVIDGSATMTLGSDATGDIYYRDASGHLERLGASTDGHVLTTGGSGTIPTWSALPSSGISWDGSTANGVATYKDGDEATVESNLTFDGTTLALADGRTLLVGGTSAVTTSVTATSQILGTTSADTSLMIGRWSADNDHAHIYFAKSRNATVGSVGIVQDDDHLGAVHFMADDGTDFNSEAASIRARIDGTPGSNDVPGRLIFSTTADGAASPTDRMVIDNAGAVTFGTFGKFQYLGSMTATTTWADIAFTNGSNLNQLYANGRAALLFYVSYCNNNGAIGERSYGYVWYSGNAEGGSNFRGTVTTPIANSGGYWGYCNLTFRIDSSKLQVQRSANTVQGWVQFYHMSVAGGDQTLG